MDKRINEKEYIEKKINHLNYIYFNNGDIEVHVNSMDLSSVDYSLYVNNFSIIFYFYETHYDIRGNKYYLPTNFNFLQELETYKILNDSNFLFDLDKFELDEIYNYTNRRLCISYKKRKN